MFWISEPALFLLHILNIFPNNDFVCVDCETKALVGEVCVASFDWKCSGICKSVERMSEVHQKCAENETSLWSGSF